MSGPPPKARIDDASLQLRATLMIEALKKYPFRPPLPSEPGPIYIAAVVEHVKSRDYGSAFEIIYGARQANWTPEEVCAFHDYLRDHHQPDHTPPANPNDLSVGRIEHGGIWNTTDDTMEQILDETIDTVWDMRRHAPSADTPILVGVLMLTGDLVITTVDRGDRIKVLKVLARDGPIYGYVMAFDAFMHAIDNKDAPQAKAQKIDCILGHMGTRTRRLVRRKPYQYVDDRRRVEPLPPMDDLIPGPQDIDPYADIFVSVPPPVGKPS